MISGEDELTSSSTFRGGAAGRGDLLVALGGLFAERAGVVNIGLEGMMILGAWGAGFALPVGLGAAVVGGLVFGALGGLLHAVATVTFGVDHVVSGVAINILAAGVARFLSELLYTDNPPGAGLPSRPRSSGPPRLSLPLLSSGPDLLGRSRAGTGSDLRRRRRAARVHHEVGVLTFAVLGPDAYRCRRTAFGFRLRSCGENPAAADSSACRSTG